MTTTTNNCIISEDKIKSFDNSKSYSYYDVKITEYEYPLQQRRIIHIHKWNDELVKQSFSNVEASTNDR